MNKRLICLLLCLAMLVVCFAGCGKKTDEEATDEISDKASDSAMTLAMYLLCDEEVSPEQAQKIETAVNKITKSKFKTQLKLYFYTADKYYEALDASFAARAAAEEAGTISAPSEEGKAEDETFINEEWGITEIKYPTIDSFQVDIFYVGGYEKFKQYSDDGWLSRLDDEVAHDSKLINDYISENYLTFMKKFNGSVYAIPNNQAIGKYQYVLLNKEVLELTRYNTDAGLASIDSITCESVQSILSQVKNYYGDQYTPLYSSLGPDGLPLNNWKYWGVDENGTLSSDFSLLACQYPNAEYMEVEASYLSNNKNILDIASFRNAYSTLKMYKENGYYGTEQQFKKGEIAVAYMEGSMDIPAKYADKYVAVPIGTPIMETEDLYKDMFAVTSYSSSVNRSMEIVTYLNTNEEFRNLLLYGIEGENYELVDSNFIDDNGDPYKVVRRLNNNYMMSPEKTGNTLITYTLEGGDPTVQKYIKQQNTNAKISVTMGFALNNDLHIVNPKWLEGLRLLTQDVVAQLNSATYAQVTDNTWWNKLAGSVNKDINFAALVQLDSEGTQYVVGIVQQYENWAVANKIHDPSAAE